MIVIETRGNRISIRKANTEDLREAAYMLLMLVPLGKTTTYKYLAEALGVHPRTIARFMALNDNPIVVPCHRVIMSDGRLGGYSLSGPEVKEKLLRLEGVKIVRGKIPREQIIDFKDLLK